MIVYEESDTSYVSSEEEIDIEEVNEADMSCRRVLAYQGKEGNSKEEVKEGGFWEVRTDDNDRKVEPDSEVEEEAETITIEAEVERDFLGKIMIGMNKTLGPVKEKKEAKQNKKNDKRKDDKKKDDKKKEERGKSDRKSEKGKEEKHREKKEDRKSRRSKESERISDKENVNKRKRESEDKVELYVKEKELEELDGMEEGEIKDDPRDKLKSYTIPKKQKVEVKSIVSRPPKRDLHDYRRHHYH